MALHSFPAQFIPAGKVKRSPLQREDGKCFWVRRESDINNVQKYMGILQLSRYNQLGSAAEVTSATADEDRESRILFFFLGPMAASAVRLASLCLIWASSCCCIWTNVHMPTWKSSLQVIKHTETAHSWLQSPPRLPSPLSVPLLPSVSDAAALGPLVELETAEPKQTR